MREGGLGRARWLAIFGLACLAAAVLPAPAEAGCSTFRHRAKVESSLFGTDLAYLNISKRICRNGRRITTKSTDMTVRPSITRNGSAVGVKFERFVGDDVSRYGSWRGVRHARWYGYSAAQFTQELCAPKLGCQKKSSFVSVSMTVYGNWADYRNTKKRRQNSRF